MRHDVRSVRVQVAFEKRGSHLRPLRVARYRDEKIGLPELSDDRRKIVLKPCYFVCIFHAAARSFVVAFHCTTSRGLRGWEFGTNCPFFGQFSNFRNFPKVSPGTRAPCQTPNPFKAAMLARPSGVLPPVTSTLIRAFTFSALKKKIKNN